jgi:hypothetical protein
MLEWQLGTFLVCFSSIVVAIQLRNFNEIGRLWQTFSVAIQSVFFLGNFSYINSLLVASLVVLIAVNGLSK